MWKQFKLLSKIQLCNLFGLNQIRYGKDEKKKRRFILLAVVCAFLGILVIAYSGIIASAFVMLGMGEILPSFTLTIVSLVTLVFTMYKAGGVLFNMQTYEMLISLPVSSATIVVSRFFSMYIQNVGFGCIVMFPATFIYGISIKAGFIFYLQVVAGVLLMPLIPMTISTAAGALITGISSRMKHKNIVSIILSLGFVIIFLVLMSVVSVENYNVEGEFILSTEMLNELGDMIQKQMYASYPPAALFSDGIINNNMIAFLKFAALSVSVFLLMVLLVQWKFVSICTALHSNRANNTYQKQGLNTNSPILSLYKKELKRYFSSSVYVLNTSICYILMVVFAAGLFFAGQERMAELLQFSGIINAIAPLILVAMCSMISTTGCSISMEGKQWWLAQSLPITSKQLFDSKILVNLTIALPCYVLAEIFMFLSLELSFFDGVWMILLPLFYLLFSSVLGITVNRKIPMLQWESETTAVKQGASVLVCMLIGMGSMIPLVAAVFAGDARHIVFIIILLLIGGTTFYLYRKNTTVDICTIGE